MTEASLPSSHKRKRLLPTTNTIRSSKCQIYLQRDKLGRFQRSSVGEETSGKPELSYRVSIKDLRARRVFSPSSSVGGGDGRRSLSSGSEDGEGVEAVCVVDRSMVEKSRDSCFEANGIIRICSDNILKEGEGIGDMENPEVGNYCDKVIDSDSPFRQQSPVTACLNGEKQACFERLVEYEEGTNMKLNSPEFVVKTTPPDAEIFGYVDEIERHVILKESVDFQNMDQKSTGGCSSKEIRQKSVLHPCRPVKLFKSPGSFSYKRLLPFLIAEGASKEDHSLKTEKQIRETPRSAEKSKAGSYQKDETHGGVSGDCLNSVLVGQNTESQISPVGECSSNPSLMGEVKNLKKDISCENQIQNNYNHDFDAIIDDSRCQFNNPNAEKCISAKDDKVESRSIISPREKLFKTPGSLAYRRLLPFYREIAKDNSCAGNGSLQQSDNLEPKPLSVLASSDCPEISKRSSIDFNNNLKLSNDDFSVLSTSISNSVKVPYSSDENVSQCPTSLELQKKQETQSEGDLMNREEFHHDHEVVDSILESPNTSLCSPLGSNCLSREGPDQLVLNNEEEREGSLVDFAISPKLNEADNLKRKLFHLEDSSTFGTRVIGSQRRILKMNPRGCRGLCTCLNCSSFQLHAEKAFEFSRSQMQDAEETVLDLVKELSNVRNMLESSVTSVDDGHAVLCTSQVKEVCKKASEAEQLAKDRLCQMNNDLYIHCRIPSKHQPKVRFANCVQETIIPREEKAK